MRSDQFFAVDTSEQPWEEQYNEKLGKTIVSQGFTSTQRPAEIQWSLPGGLREPESYAPVWPQSLRSRRNAGHAQGHVFPGTFVWFSRGEVMEHGRLPKGDVTVLFITNKRFRIDYVD